MINFRLNVDPNEVLGRLSDFQRRQLPMAIAVTLTRTARLARERLVAKMSSFFQNPVRATITAPRYKAARKSDPVIKSEVFILDEGSGKALSPAKWLGTEVQGGPRRDKRLEVALRMKGILPAGMQVVPGDQAPELDPHGNFRGAFVTRLLSQLQGHWQAGYSANETAASKKRAKGTRRDVFAGRPKGRNLPFGVWERIDSAFGKTLRPIMVFTKAGRYQKRMPLLETVELVNRQETADHLRQALADAVRTSGFKGAWK